MGKMGKIKKRRESEFCLNSSLIVSNSRHFSPQKADARFIHNLSILSSFMLRKMFIKHSFQKEKPEKVPLGKAKNRERDRKMGIKGKFWQILVNFLILLSPCLSFSLALLSYGTLKKICLGKRDLGGL